MFSTKRKSALGGRIYPLWVSATYGRLAESQPESPGRSAVSQEDFFTFSDRPVICRVLWTVLGAALGTVLGIVLGIVLGAVFGRKLPHDRSAADRARTRTDLFG